MLLLTLAVLGLCIILMVYRIALRSPNVLYKIQSGNTCNSLSILFLIVYVYWIGRPQFMDLGVVYVVLNYVGTMAVLKYMQRVYKASTRTEEGGDNNT